MQTVANENRKKNREEKIIISSSSKENIINILYEGGTEQNETEQNKSKFIGVWRLFQVIYYSLRCVIFVYSFACPIHNNCQILTHRLSFSELLKKPTQATSAYMVQNIY